MSTRPFMQRPPHYVLDKIVRFSSWPLLLIVLAFLVTGYAMSGQYGLGMVIDAKRALLVHKALHGPLAAFFLVHVLPASYLAFKRWGWIGKLD